MDSCNRLGKTRRPQISVEIDYILSFPDEIVKRFALTPKNDELGDQIADHITRRRS